MQEMIWIAGPMLATFGAAMVSTAAPIYICAGATLIGAVWFTSTPAVAAVSLPRSTSRFGSVLRNRSLVTSMVVFAFAVASYNAMQVGIIARFDDDPMLTGYAIAVASAGSLVGGLAFGHRRLGFGGTMLALVAITVGTGLTAVFADPIGLGVALFLSGLGFAPSLAALFLMISLATEATDAAEAFGWLATAALVGGAVGTALAGLVVDAASVTATLVLATGISAVAAVALALIRWGGPIAGMSRDRAPTDPSRMPR